MISFTSTKKDELARLLPYIVPKGFIAIDGTSLTVCDVDHSAGTFNFMLISFTQEKNIHINLGGQ